MVEARVPCKTVMLESPVEHRLLPICEHELVLFGGFRRESCVEAIEPIAQQASIGGHLLILVPHLTVLLPQTLVVDLDVLNHIPRSKIDFLDEVSGAVFVHVDRLGYSLNFGRLAESHNPVAGFAGLTFVCLLRYVRLESLGVTFRW